MPTFVLLCGFEIWEQPEALPKTLGQKRKTDETLTTLTCCAGQPGDS